MKYLYWIFIVFIILSCSESKEVKRQQLFLKGNIALEERNYDQAIYYYDQAIELSDTFPSAFNNRAIAYQEKKENQNAFKDYEKAIAVDPGFWQAYFNRAKLWQQTGNFKNALTDLEQIEKPYEDSASFYFVKGLAFTGLKQYENAEDAFLQAKQLNPSNLEASINLANVYYYQKRYDESRVEINEVLATENHPQALNLSGLISVEMENYDKAIQHFTEAIKISPNPYFYNNRGYALLLSGDLEEGMDDIKYSLLKDETNPWAYRNKGVYHYLSDEMESAKNSLLQAYQMDTTVGLTNYYLGMVNYELGEKSEACKYLYRSSLLKEKEGQQSYDQYCQ